MATQVQFRRGTTGETALFTGAVGEVTVDITKDTCVVHDGFTQGGFPLMREDGSNMELSSGNLSSCALKFAADYNTGIISPGPDQITFVTGGVARLGIDSSGAASFANNVLVGGNLSVTGSLSLSGVVSFAAGTAAAPSITFTGDTNTGIYSPGADQIGFTTGGVSKLILDASGNGSFAGHVDIASTKEYRINGTKILDATSLGSSVVASSLTSVGTIGTGTWQGSTITHGYGGTGHTSYTSGQLLIGKADGTLAKATLTASTGVTITNGDGTITISAIGSGGTVTAVTGTAPLASTGGNTPDISLNLKPNGGLVTETNNLAVDLSASGITGTLATSDGGTGQTTYTDGQLLIGNSVGNTLSKSTLTAGSGVTIANGNGTITISATGSGGTVTSVTASSPLASTGGTTPDISIQDGTTAQKGAVQLEDSTSSTSTTKAATPNSVKTAYDLANAALPKAGGTLTGNLTLNAQSDLRFADADSSNWVAFQAPATVVNNITWTLPDIDGSSGQFLRTNGSGVLSWGSGGGGGGGASVTTSDTPPVAPNHGDLWYDSVGGRTYVYYGDGNSSQWVDVAPQGLVSVTTSDTAPVSPNPGAFWYDSVGGRTYVYYNDGNTSQWVDASPQGLISVVTSDTPPPAPIAGAFWYDSSVGRTYIYYNDGNTSQWVDSSPQATGPQSLISVGNTTAEVIDTGSNGRFTVTTEGVERLRVTSSGNVGIGTSTPARTLDINGTTRIADGAAIEWGGTSAFISGTSTSNALLFNTTSTERLRIDSSGRVGVGNSSPSFNLDVTGTFRSTGEGRFDNAINLKTATLNYIYFDDAIAFSRNGTGERLRIDSSGRVGIATTSPATTLDLSGAYSSNAVAVGALDIDCSVGNYFTKTINANSTFTFSNPPGSRSYGFTLELTHTSGTVTWPAAVQWPGGTAPTLTTGKVHLFIFVTDDGGTIWRGSSLINYNS